MANQKFFVCCVAVLAIAVASHFFGAGYGAKLMIWIALAALVASTLRFVMLIGELNFATAAFYGIGAYTAGVATTMLEWPFIVSFLAGGVVAALISTVFGFITLRTKGPYFLLIGFAFAEVMRIIYTKMDWLGGNSGLIGIFVPEALDVYLTPFVILVSGSLIGILYLIEVSNVGKIFTAIKDNEGVARSVGIRVHLSKVACFVIASFAVGIAGSLHAYTNNVISPGDFGFLLSTFALAYLKVGGEEHPLGPILGAALLILLNALALDSGLNEHIFYGAAIVAAMLLLPKGVAGLVGRWFTADRCEPGVKVVARRAQ
ncbi:branched-chain amino acid ABC transporter permease [Metapseudomonas lalkuanensis]|nr:branched-chain amino acid ABC transporter permease [Pseudomonas lalkuanensis]